MDHSSSDNDDEVELPLSHPARIREFGSKNEKNRGWGESMELARTRETNRGKESSSSIVAVDLNQFRNTEVGTGYQAKHVVRQRSAAAQQTKITTINDKVHGRQAAATGPAKTIGKEELLRNEGLRAFRKEIESILSSS